MSGDYDDDADFAAEEIGNLKEHVKNLLRQLDGVLVKNQQQTDERDAACASIS